MSKTTTNNFIIQGYFVLNFASNGYHYYLEMYFPVGIKCHQFGKAQHKPAVAAGCTAQYQAKKVSG